MATVGNARRSSYLAYSVPVLSVLAALLLGAIMLVLLDASPVEGVRAMFDGAFGSGDALISTALKATPLLLVGVGITIAFRANVINIGGEGQMVAGGLLSTALALALGDALPAILMVPLVLLAGIVGGAIWGAIPGALKAYYGVNEILSTIMLNIVAVQLMNYLLRGPMIDPGEIERGTRIPQTQRLPEAADLPLILGNDRLHIGPLIAVLAAIFAYILLWRTPLGYRVRAVGQNPDASRYAGIPVKRTVVLALTMSGAMAGLAGAILVFGSESHRMVTDGSTAGFTGSAGFNGIVAALFGGLHPVWTIPASFLFGGLLVGGNALQRAVQVPSALILALNGLVVIFVVSTDRYKRLLRDRASAAETAARLAELEEANSVSVAAGANGSDPPDRAEPPPEGTGAAEGRDE
ncbi:MAG: ABC transporter permease [Acidimicrobiia bacterium]|nr:ABC transporter permease [Acidimicrobiia bacterium]